MMRKRQISNGEEAVHHDNARVADAEQDPATEWTWEPLKRDSWALAIIAAFERHYRDRGNPAFVWAARQIARDLLWNLPRDAPGLQWIEAYIDTVTERMAGLVSAPPSKELNNHIAEALGFDPHPGPGQGSALSDAQRVIRDVRLAGEVAALLPHVGDKEWLAVEDVMKRNGLGRTTVWDAFRKYGPELK
jgi:hypothetical protein